MALYFMPKSHRAYSTPLPDEEMASVDEAEGEVSVKMEKLISLLEIPATEFDARRSACAELRELLRKYYPDCLLLTYGSSLNGFGMKFSDLDLLFLPFPGYCNFDYVTKETLTLPEPAGIVSGVTPKDVLSKLDEFSHVKFIRNVLRKEKKLVFKTNLIPAKSPSLKIHLTNNKILCDLTASNKIVVFNSELLQFFEKLDNRVKPLVMVLRYWAQFLGFIKKTFLTSYAFTLMVIFYLQNTSPPILPSVQHLMEIAGFSRMIAGWQTAFTTDQNDIDKSKNTQTTTELLLQFFQFYWNFDFVQYAVSPYHGKPLLIKDIKSSEDKRFSEFVVNSINIQDPFILSSNVCRREGPHNVLKMGFFTAYQMLLDKSGQFKFSMLFNPDEYDKIFHLQYEKYLCGKQRVFFINMDYDCFANLMKSTKGTQVWYDKTCQTVFDVLQYGLLMECDVIDKIPSLYKRDDMESNGASLINLNENSNTKNSPFELELLLSMQCVVYSRIWVGRKNQTKQVENGDEFEEFSHVTLKDEYNISKTMLKNNPLIDSPAPLLCFKCECYKHGSPQIADIVVILKPLTASREFHQVASFLQAFLPKTVKKILSSD